MEQNSENQNLGAELLNNKKQFSKSRYIIGILLLSALILTGIVVAYPRIVLKIISGQLRTHEVRVTLMEGETRYEMAQVLSKALPDFKSVDFMTFTQGDEGYLFPDTYYFSQTSTASDVVQKLSDTFMRKTAMLRAEPLAHSWSDTVIMASIIEKEAASDPERPIIAGILWKRLAKPMPLGVDAAFSYILGKSSAELTVSDLHIDSPYNTYTHLGLPPTPIGNPGLASLEAAAHPVDSPYWYYLHDKNGIIHYAETFAEHIKNKQNYLK